METKPSLEGLHKDCGGVVSIPVGGCEARLIAEALRMSLLDYVTSRGEPATLTESLDLSSAVVAGLDLIARFEVAARFAGLPSPEGNSALH